MARRRIPLMQRLRLRSVLGRKNEGRRRRSGGGVRRRRGRELLTRRGVERRRWIVEGEEGVEEELVGRGEL